MTSHSHNFTKPTATQEANATVGELKAPRPRCTEPARPFHVPNQPEPTTHHHNGTTVQSKNAQNGSAPRHDPQVLADNHRVLIEASAITPDVAQATGYATIPDSDAGRARLQELGFKAPGQMLLPALHIPAHDVNGNIHAGQIRPDIPRNGSTGKPIKYESPKGARLIVDVPPMVQLYLHDPKEELWITEGKRKADSAVSHGLRCISLMGVSGWRSTNEAGGKTTSACWSSIALNGREIVLAFDSDVTRKDTVQRQLAELKSYLESRGALVRVLYLPEGPGGEKTGLDDFFARGGTVETLRDHISEELRPTDKQRKKAEKIAAKQKAMDARGLPQIETNDGQLSEKLNSLSAAIAKYNGESPVLFWGVSGLVEIGRDKNGEPILRHVTRERMQVLASKAATWVSTTEREGPRDVEPPRDLCAQFLVSPDLWQNVPEIESIMTAPFVDWRGDICATPGYHASEKVWLSLPDGFTLPDTTPSAANIKTAKKLLLGNLLGEVAFADEASRANALGLMILPFVRRHITAQTPLHLFDANVQSTGKTYAAQVCLAPFCEATITCEKRNDEESRKSLLANLATGASHIFIDNVKGDLSDSALATAITTGKLQDRLIGTGQMVTVSTRVVWVATSNNAQLDRDAVSRQITIRLDANEESPEGREFRSDPLQFIADNRPQVLAAILTLVRAWLDSGRPELSGKTRSRFKLWEKTIGGILEAIEVPCFLDNIEEARSLLDPETAAWREFVCAWHKAYGERYTTAKELLSVALKCGELAAMIGEKEGHAQRFGKMLQQKRDRIFADFKILRAAGKSNMGVKWRISAISKPGNPENDPKNDPKGDDGGDGDDVHYPTRKVQISDNDTNTVKEFQVSRRAGGCLTNVTIVTNAETEDDIIGGSV